ncbi:MAG: formate dehydrogenase [Kiloniellales bacterium]|nr:formate dehydrogenase [Kiloniellales bacterium]
MTEKDQKREVVSRRGFFGAASKGLALGAGAVVTAAGGAQAAEVAPDGTGYRETPHVKTYYDSTKF